MKYFGIILTFLMLALASCQQKTEQVEQRAENAQAKQMMQGVWVNEDNNEVVFMAKGDTLFYPYGGGEAVRFVVIGDTLVVEGSTPVRYAVKSITAETMHIVNVDGDDIRLTKSSEDRRMAFVADGDAKGELNQGVTLKRDSVMNAGGRKLHAYVQVNPTRYKVLRQSLTAEGVTVDNAYYDNIVHVALYEGAKPVVSRDFRRKDFEKYVPANYLERSILSDIIISGVKGEDVLFTAMLVEPETYTSYRVLIRIAADGEIMMSV